ncbi:MAG TPA: Rap1a/Tai family immunity protein [Acidisphaera sp.]|nr:Rap1a/Tai family immunity protein [Acidisphaera sp.]
MRIVRWVTALALCAIAAPGVARAAVTQDSFLLRNTADLVDLCTADQSDPTYTPAVNFCHGFALGVFRVLNEEDVARRRRVLFCPKDPTPSRNEAIAAFVAWVKANPAQMDALPADSIAAYLHETYPCPHPAAAARRTHP